MNETKDSETNPPVVLASGETTNGPRNGQIANVAYFIWMSEGCPVGRDTNHWYQAEEQLRTYARSTPRRTQLASRNKCYIISARLLRERSRKPSRMAFGSSRHQAKTTSRGGSIE
jgi:hypothetical protein